LPSADDIVDLLAAEAKSGDIFLIMSNGSFDGLCEKLLKKLSARQIPSEANAR
jgi:UDP-N-acetylmuramate-alanine ligase